MEELILNTKDLAHAFLFSFLMFLFGRMLYALSAMRTTAKKTWQKFLTEFLTALFGVLGISAMMIILTGVKG